MALRLTKENKQLLASIAEHRILTVGLLSTLHECSTVYLRRRIKLPGIKELIQCTSRALRHTPGRPDNLLSLTADGVEFLKKHNLLGRNVPCDSVTAQAIPCPDHQLLTNVLRVQLVDVERQIAALRIRFLAPNSPYTPCATTGQPLLLEKFTSSELPVRDYEFIPDGVFTITHEELRKTLLFFLEVDMGTQTLVSSRHAKRDIQQKILNYRALFQSGQYRRYEGVFHDTLRGFRLLFVTTDAERLASLASLVRDNAPANFIWLTDRESLETGGAGGNIWLQGGDEAQPRQSILGSKAPNDRPPPRKRG